MGFYRSWTVEDKLQLVTEFKTLESNISFRDFCRRNNVPRTTFENWLKKFDNKTLSLDLRKYNGRKISIERAKIVSTT